MLTFGKVKVIRDPGRDHGKASWLSVGMVLDIVDDDRNPWGFYILSNPAESSKVLRERRHAKRDRHGRDIFMVVTGLLDKSDNDR